MSSSQPDNLLPKYNELNTCGMFQTDEEFEEEEKLAEKKKDEKSPDGNDSNSNQLKRLNSPFSPSPSIQAPIQSRAGILIPNAANNHNKKNHESTNQKTANRTIVAPPPSPTNTTNKTKGNRSSTASVSSTQQHPQLNPHKPLSQNVMQTYRTFLVTNQMNIRIPTASSNNTMSNKNPTIQQQATASPQENNDCCLWNCLSSIGSCCASFFSCSCCDDDETSTPINSSTDPTRDLNHLQSLM